MSSKLSKYTDAFTRCGLEEIPVKGQNIIPTGTRRSIEILDKGFFLQDLSMKVAWHKICVFLVLLRRQSVRLFRREFTVSGNFIGKSITSLSI